MAMIARSKVTDIRGALEVAERRGELLRISRPVEPGLQLPSLLRALGKLPSKPAVLFEQIAGFPGLRGCGGLFAERARVADLLGLPQDRVTRKQTYLDALDHPLLPTTVSTGPCKENVVKENIDLGKLIFATRGAEHVTHQYYQPVVIL